MRKIHFKIALNFQLVRIASQIYVVKPASAQH